MAFPPPLGPWKKHLIGSIVAIAVMLLLWSVFLSGYVRAMEDNRPYREFYTCIIYGVDARNEVPLGPCHQRLFEALNEDLLPLSPHDKQQ